MKCQSFLHPGQFCISVVLLFTEGEVQRVRLVVRKVLHNKERCCENQRLKFDFMLV